MQVIIIGRGHGGTRVASHTLSASGIYMGTNNVSGDLIPAKGMCEAVKTAGSLVKRNSLFPYIEPLYSEIAWDFSQLIASNPPDAFVSAVNQYLFHFDGYGNGYSDGYTDTQTFDGYIPYGWKLPETVFALPWITKMFPNAYYIYWTRDPRDCILGGHTTDRLSVWGAPSVWYPNIIDARIESWAYQYQMMQDTPLPKNVIHMKYEDFISNQTSELNRLSQFLQMPMSAIPVFATDVGLYKTAPANNLPDKLLQYAGYI
jgi:hypothetical protein